MRVVFKNSLVNLINCEILLLTSFFTEKDNNFLKIGKEISLIVAICSVLYYLILLSMSFINLNNGNFLLLKGKEEFPLNCNTSCMFESPNLIKI